MTKRSEAAAEHAGNGTVEATIGSETPCLNLTEREDIVMRLHGRFFCYAVLVCSAFCYGESASAPDIEAVVEDQWGTSAPVKLFGQDAAVGEVVKGNLDLYYSDGGITQITAVDMRDPLPDRTECVFAGHEGTRNTSFSGVSRIWRHGGVRDYVLLVINTAAGTGFYPGSKGYVRITNKKWRVKKVVINSEILHDHEGFGVKITKGRRGTIEWHGRGGCPACACPENECSIVVLLQRKGLPDAP